MGRAGLEMARLPLLGPPTQVLCRGEVSVHKYDLEGSKPKASVCLITTHFRQPGGAELASYLASRSRQGFFPGFIHFVERAVLAGPLATS